MERPIRRNNINAEIASSAESRCLLAMTNKWCHCEAMQLPFMAVAISVVRKGTKPLSILSPKTIKTKCWDCFVGLRPPRNDQQRKVRLLRHSTSFRFSQWPKNLQGQNKEFCDIIYQIFWWAMCNFYTHWAIFTQLFELILPLFV